MFNWRNR